MAPTRPPVAPKHPTHAVEVGVRDDDDEEAPPAAPRVAGSRRGGGDREGMREGVVAEVGNGVGDGGRDRCVAVNTDDTATVGDSRMSRMMQPLSTFSTSDMVPIRASEGHAIVMERRWSDVN